MPSGILGKAAPAVNSNVTVYTVPAGKLATVNLSLCNRSPDARAIVRIALASTATPTTAEYIMYDVELSPNGFLERTGVVMQAGVRVVVYSSTANVSAVVYGMED